MEQQIPQHIAIIMDGNGRWAKKRFLPRMAGHSEGLNALKKIVKHCHKIGVKHLTVFAFGRENWNRPQEEVSFLMNLMLKRIPKEVKKMHENNVIIHFIGDKSRLNQSLVSGMNDAEKLTANNSGLHVNVCLDYSGQYDIVQAVNKIIEKQLETPINEEEFAKYLLTAGQPAPELLIRTSGEFRISNFMLWQIAYSELYFSEVYWPDFGPKDLDQAIVWYTSRERRFGKISEQLKE